METPIPVKLILLRWIITAETGDVGAPITPEQAEHFLGLNISPKSLPCLGMENLTRITNEIDWTLIEPYRDWCNLEAETNFKNIPKDQKSGVTTYWYMLNELWWAWHHQSIPELLAGG